MIKNTHIWIASYFAQVAKRVFLPRPKELKHVIFCVADHFEPRWGKVGPGKEVERTDNWTRQASAILKKHLDTDKKTPVYTLFYPIDELTPPVLEKIADFCKQGYGEVEVHLHHDNDTSEGLRKKLEHAKDVFSKRGLLGRDKVTGAIKYGFVHGNWSLGNSRRDGKWCGVNNELTVLKETGCYADFTLPSAPSETQTRKINSIYYAKDTGAPKPHNTGVDVRLLRRPKGLLAMTDGVTSSSLRGPDLSAEALAKAEGAEAISMTKELMIIQGPLALNWKCRKFGIFPRIENGGITMKNPPTKDRIDLWVRQGVGVKGKPEWVFVKVYAHGAQDDNLKDAYFDNLDKMFGCLEEKYNNGERYKLHYVTAREMYNIVKAAEAGESGEPGEYRDYLLASNMKK